MHRYQHCTSGVVSLCGAAATVLLSALLLCALLQQDAQARPGERSRAAAAAAAAAEPATTITANVFERNYSSAALTAAANCGYKSCPKTDAKRLNVHIIAHTHDDVGWLKTVDQYYYGTNKKFSQAGVQYIMDSVVPQLLMDKTKRFIYVEMSFFSKWWAEQEEPMRSMVRYLVNEGRLEFINGGWCMNDEATVTYHSTIEQMTLGLRFLNETFGACGRPKVGWQIDPFGHTNEQASLFAQFGFDGMFFTRISYLDKLNRIQNQSLDLIWHGDRVLPGQAGSIFTNIFKDGYDAPNGFCFDSLCLDDAIVDNRKSFEYNAEKKGDEMIRYIRKYAEAKLTNHMLIPMGGDFQYTAAGQNFKSLDKLIKYVRTRAPDIHIFYSTPSCYQYAIYESVMQLKEEMSNEPQTLYLPEKYDDFMPYDSTSSIWWSGYFTSRPSVKLVERETANLLQVTRIVSTAELIKQQQQPHHEHASWTKGVKLHELRCLGPLWEVLGDLQHHDAVTGTEKQHVADDYVRRAAGARRLCAKFIGDFARKKLDDALKRSTERYEQLKKSAKRLQLDPIYLEETMFCPLLNISQCDALESDVDSNRLMPGASPVITEKSLGLVHKFSHDAPSPQAAATSSAAHKSSQLPKELETKSVLMTAYNPLARPVSQVDVRLPCNGRCDLEKVRVIHLAKNETLKLIRLPAPAGITSLPFRNATTNYEMLFYISIPPLGTASFVILDENLDDIIDEESDLDDSILVTDESPLKQAASQPSRVVRSRRTREATANEAADASGEEQRYQHFEMLEFAGGSSSSSGNDDGNQKKVRNTRESKPTYDEGGHLMPGADEPHTQQEYPTQQQQQQQQQQQRQSTPAPVQQAQVPQQQQQQQQQQASSSDRVIVKFDMHSGVITGLKRVNDGSVLNITQKFGYYFPADTGPQPGAYIFRPNSSEPHLLHKPTSFRMYKRQNGALIEIHQKWADWIWQTIRVDAKKNYIEFDYVVGPIPAKLGGVGREVVTRYLTNMANEGVFLTDSNARQLLPRHRLRNSTGPNASPTQLGGSFFPVVSTMMIRNNRPSKSSKSAEAVSVLVDRAQAGTSLNEGDLELLVHRRHLADDNWGVAEALDEPGEDGRGLVTRGRHRLYLKFLELPPTQAAVVSSDSSDQQQQQSQPTSSGSNNKRALRRAQPSVFLMPITPRANLSYEQRFATLFKNGNDFSSLDESLDVTETYIINDQLLNDIRQESIKYALKPIFTFDRLRVSASELMQMLASDTANSKARSDTSLLNATLPDNIHLLTLQPWNGPVANQVLIRLENLDNPLTLHPLPDYRAYASLLNSYKATYNNYSRVLIDPENPCFMHAYTATEIDVEYLIRGVRITSLDELNLGANNRLAEDTRLDWTQERANGYNCNTSENLSSVSLRARQIRTFLASFEPLQ